MRLSQRDHTESYLCSYKPHLILLVSAWQNWSWEDLLYNNTCSICSECAWFDLIWRMNLRHDAQRWTSSLSRVPETCRLCAQDISHSIIGVPFSPGYFQKKSMRLTIWPISGSNISFSMRCLSWWLHFALKWVTALHFCLFLLFSMELANTENLHN